LSRIKDPTEIAGRFLEARRAATGLDDYPGSLPATLEEAYRVQDEAISRWPQPVVGWKVGRVFPPLSEQFGTDRLAGPIFTVRHVVDAEPVPMPIFADGFAAGEAEFLLRVGAVPPPGKDRFTIADAAALIDAVYVGIEIASSPLGSINELGPIAIVSDFGNNNGLVIGGEVEDWRSSNFEEWRVTALVDGVEVGDGSAINFPEGAMGSARFLFELMARRGIPLRPGQWISSGAVTGVHSVRPGQVVSARFGDRLAVACRLTAAQPEGGGQIDAGASSSEEGHGG
jgi:2-keto-4-pentenoate hydratase